MLLIQQKSFEFIYKIGTINVINPKWDFARNKLEKNTFLIVIFMRILYIIFFLSELYYFGRNSYRIVTVARSFNGFILIAEDFLGPFIGNLILLNSWNEKWCYLLKLIIKTNQTVEYERFYKNPITVQFTIAHLTFVCCASGVQWFYFKDYHEELFYYIITVLAYVFNIYLLCVFSCNVFSILTLIKSNFKELRLRKSNFFEKWNTTRTKTLWQEYKRNLEACQVFNELFGFILFFYGLLACIELITGITGALDVALGAQKNIEPFVSSTLMGFLSLVMWCTYSFTFYY